MKIENLFFSFFLILNNFCLHIQVSKVNNFRDGLMKIIFLNCFDTKQFCLHNQFSKDDNFRDSMLIFLFLDDSYIL